MSYQLLAAVSALLCVSSILAWVLFAARGEVIDSLREKNREAREKNAEISRNNIQYVADLRRKERQLEDTIKLMLFGMGELDKISIALWGSPPLPQRRADDMVATIEGLKQRILNLEYWKAQALKVDPPIQEIGYELRDVIPISMGDSIHDKILPGIRVLKARVEDLQRQIENNHAPGDDMALTTEAGS